MAVGDKESEIFRKYIQARKVLIADPNSTSRTGVMKILVDMGANPQRIVSARTFAEAVDEIEKHMPDVVLAEYELDRSCGLDLLQAQRAKKPDSKKCLFILVTRSASQSTVAQAAEEDVDAFILKPFTPEVLRRTIMNVAVAKIKPSPYMVTIDEGKKLLSEGKLDDAETKFKEATKMEAKPALAHYYVGQVEYIKKFAKEAQGAYKTGLEFNKIHYKCMVGLYELLMEGKKHEDAYDIVKRLSQYFPANPKRLSEVLRLAIINGKYEDVEKYYAVFCNMDERNDTLIKYICAALVVCGKYYLKTNNRRRALELFQKAAVTSAGRVNILKEIVQACVDQGMFADADTYLKRFPPETHKSPEYLLLRFQVVAVKGDPHQAITEGRALIQQGVADERTFDLTIERSLQASIESVTRQLVEAASVKFPAKKDKFEAYLKQLPEKSEDEDDDEEDEEAQA